MTDILFITGKIAGSIFRKYLLQKVVTATYVFKIIVSIIHTGMQVSYIL